MTWFDVLLYGPGWFACALILADALLERRSRRRYERNDHLPRPNWPFKEEE